MKVTRILALVVLMVVIAGAVQAQETTRLAWNSCNAVPDQTFTGPAIYKLVLSCIGATGLYSGHDTLVNLGPAFPIPDAWRFDDLGCEGNTLIAFSNAGLVKTCPALQGTAPLGITNYGYDTNISPYVQIRMANTFNEFNAVSTQRYTLFIVSFDMTYAVTGPGDPPNSCGGAEIGMNFQSMGTEFLHTDGHLSKDTTNSELFATWQGGAPIPTQTTTTTWSRMKGLYR